MSPPTAPNSLILFHYPFSPYARRIVFYLHLRQIPYAQCLVPSIMPRAPLNTLNIAYRRIPLLSIGADIYCDTRIILAQLETMEFAGALPPLGGKSGEHKAVEWLLRRYTVDAGIFVRAASLIPGSMPAMSDEKFIRDREDFSGRSWSREARERGRGEGLVYIRDIFALVEGALLADGREWVLGTGEPSLADVEGMLSVSRFFSLGLVRSWECELS